MVLKLFVLVFFTALSYCYAQSDSVNYETDRIVDDLLEEPDDETDNSDLYEMLEYYITHPVNINFASIEDLSDLPGMNLSAAKLIIDHKNKFGRFFSINELYSIPGIPPDFVKAILPFLTVSDNKITYAREHNTSSVLSVKIRNRFLTDLQWRKGFLENKFEGSSYKLYTRMQTVYDKNISLGILTDKDPGENYFYDFSSGYLEISNWMNFNNIIVGDYIVKFGQGLALWSPFGILKGSNAVFSIKKHSSIIQTYTGGMENNFFRGAGFEYNWEHVSLAEFYSRNSLDANLDSSTGFIISTPIDGYHRTREEILKRKTLIETTYGITLKYNISDLFSIGFLYYKSHFDHPFKPSKLYDKNGDNFNYFSTCYDLFIQNFNVYGETASDGKAVITFNGLKFSPFPEFAYVLSIRNYPPDYSNIHGFGFGESSGAAQNEFGIYNGFQWKTKFGILDTYFDQFKFPYATYSNPLPSEGNEFMINFSNKSIKNLEMILRYKYENKEVSEEISLRDEFVRRIKQSFRLEMVYGIADNIRLKSRFEYTRTFIRNIHLSEEGYLLYEDLRVELLKNFFLSGRGIFFQTDSFNSSIYEYENDFNGVLNNVGLYGEGARFYLILMYDLDKKYSLSVKYSETYKPGVSSMGTGYSEINGNIDNRIGFQIDINL